MMEKRNPAKIAARWKSLEKPKEIKVAWREYSESLLNGDDAIYIEKGNETLRRSGIEKFTGNLRV